MSFPRIDHGLPEGKTTVGQEDSQLAIERRNAADKQRHHRPPTGCTYLPSLFSRAEHRTLTLHDARTPLVDALGAAARSTHKRQPHLTAKVEPQSTYPTIGLSYSQKIDLILSYEDGTSHCRPKASQEHVFCTRVNSGVVVN